MYRNLLHLYTLPEREIKKTIPFAIASKRIKDLGINLSKEVKDLYAESYMTLMKKFKRIQTDVEIYHVLGLEESTL